jgi:hypothetical protein
MINTSICYFIHIPSSLFSMVAVILHWLEISSGMIVVLFLVVKLIVFNYLKIKQVLLILAYQCLTKRMSNPFQPSKIFITIDD